MPDKPLPPYHPYHEIKRTIDSYLSTPDPAQPVAATVEPLFMLEELTTTHTYHCQMPASMFHKLFNQQDLPNGFTIEYVYGHESFLVTYDPTADIPCHPDCEVLE